MGSVDITRDGAIANGPMGAVLAICRFSEGLHRAPVFLNVDVFFKGDRGLLVRAKSADTEGG
jgi:hypothetical protein